MGELLNVDEMVMLGPRNPMASSLKRTSTRDLPCVRQIDTFDLRIEDLDGEDILDVLDQQIEQRESMIAFLEGQLQAWSQHPSASTWSEPHRDEA